MSYAHNYLYMHLFIDKNDIENNTLELPPLGIYKINSNDTQDCSLFPWQLLDEDSHRQLEQLYKCSIRVKVLPHVELIWSTPDLNNTKVTFLVLKPVNNTHLLTCILCLV